MNDLVKIMVLLVFVVYISIWRPIRAKRKVIFVIYIDIWRPICAKRKVNMRLGFLTGLWIYKILAQRVAKACQNKDAN